MNCRTDILVIFIILHCLVPSTVFVQILLETSMNPGYLHHPSLSGFQHYVCSDTTGDQPEFHCTSMTTIIMNVN